MTIVKWKISTTVNGTTILAHHGRNGQWLDFGQMLDQGSAFACLLKSVAETNRSNWALGHKGVKNLQWTHANSLFPCIIETEQRKYEPHSLQASLLNR